MILQKIKDLHQAFLVKDATNAYVAFHKLVLELALDKFTDAAREGSFNDYNITYEPVRDTVADGVAYLRAVFFDDKIIRQHIADAFSGYAWDDEDDLNKLWEVVNDTSTS